jgi:predicted RNA-binding Zn-ribbon protein involved in translation (DUF1610 family)
VAEAFVNGVGWIDVPERDPGRSPSAATFWSDNADTTLRALLPHYYVERIAWSLGRTILAIRQRMDKLEIDRPHIDQRGSPDNRGSDSSREMVVTETGRKVLAGEARPPRWADANGAPEAEKPRPKKRRRCLSCPRTFISEGPWNHVCPTCRESKEWRSPAAAAWPCQEAT